MSNNPRGRRPTPAASADTRRDELRALRDSITARGDQRRQAQASRLTQAHLAADAGASVRDVVEATGLSRAYLHRVGIRAGQTRQDAAADEALEEARRIRDQLAELNDLDEQEKAQRKSLALELLDSGAEISEKELADDAGVTPEWVRRRFTDL